MSECQLGTVSVADAEQRPAQAVLQSPAQEAQSQASPWLQRGRVASLDGLRAFAVLFVLWGHAGRTVDFPDSWQDIDAYVPSGAFGVRVFFVLSGFIITLLLAREWHSTGKINLREFYLRRCLRILPAMGAYLLFVALLEAFTVMDEPFLGWLTSLTFTKNFYAPCWITGHLWSLSVEEQFYVFWPGLLALCPATWRIRAAYLLIPLALASRVFLLATGHSGFAHASLFTNMDFLMVGAVLALWLAARPRLELGDAAWHALLGMSLLGLVGLQDGESHGAPFWSQCLVPTLAAALIAVALMAVVHIGRGPLFRFLNARPVVYLGRLSYSLYLWQQAFCVLGGFYDYALAPLTYFPLNVFAAFGMAVLSYEFVEKPCLKFKDSVFGGVVARDRSR